MLIALFELAATPAPSPVSSATPAAATAENDPTSQVRTATLQTTYTPATYGPQNFRIEQFFIRLSTLRVGKSLLRLTLPRLQTINGVDQGLGDMQAFYLFQHPARTGSAFAGVSAQLPTSSNFILGSPRWLIGPAGAYVFVFAPRKAIAGILLQTAFSVAGPKSSPRQSVLTFLPFASLAIGGGWFLKWPEAPWVFDLQRGASLIPLGLGIGRTEALDSEIVLLSLSGEVEAVHANAPNAPKNTVRFTVTILVRSG